MTDTLAHQSASIANVPFCTSAPGETIEWRVGTSGGVGRTEILARGTRTGLRCTAAVLDLPPGGESRLHAHLVEDEGFYVLAGGITFLMPDDGLELTAGPGEFVWHPSHRMHGFRVGETGARVLQLLRPGTSLMPDLFLRLGQLTGAPGEPEELQRWLREHLGMLTAGSLSPGPPAMYGPWTPDARLPAREQAPGVGNRPFRSDRADVRTLAIGGGLASEVTGIVHAHGHQTGGAFALLERTMARGDVVAPHVHTLEDEGFYVLDGELTLMLGTPGGPPLRVAAGPGDFAWAPRGLPHAVEATGQTGARVLSLATPGDTYSQFIDEVMSAREGAVVRQDVVRRSAEGYGIHFVERLSLR